MSTKNVYVVVALSDNPNGCPRIIGVYTNKQVAEKVASTAPYWWCNVIERELNTTTDGKSMRA